MIYIGENEITNKIYEFSVNIFSFYVIDIYIYIYIESGVHGGYKIFLPVGVRLISSIDNNLGIIKSS